MACIPQHRTGSDHQNASQISIALIRDRSWTLSFLQPLLVLFVSVAAVPESAFSCFPSRWFATHHHGNLATSKEVHSVFLMFHPVERRQRHMRRAATEWAVLRRELMGLPEGLALSAGRRWGALAARQAG
jgi:hypothetical protein